MAKLQICIGCGLTVGLNKELIADTGGPVPPPNPYVHDTCTEDDLSAVICRADGTLAGLPDVSFKKASSLNNNFDSAGGSTTVAKGPGALLVGLPFDVPESETTVFLLTNDNLIKDGGVKASSFKNPSNCRSALVIMEIEFDVDMNIPSGRRVRTFIASDRMWETTNNGPSTLFDQGYQATKLIFSRVNPGATFQVPNIALAVNGDGAGNAPKLTRAQYIFRIAILAIG